MKYIKLFEEYGVDLSSFDPEAMDSLLLRKGFTKLEDLESMDERTRNIVLYYYEAGFIDGKKSK